ncbi:hypothetical protein ES702_01008 [subsurface metagenome]
MAKQDIPSFEKINYLLRPKKQIERKISIEILQELQQVVPGFEDFRYIGMGSIYYYDYILFHKFLKFKKYTSLDNKRTPKRFVFNKPYDFIDFQNVHSTDFLENFEYDSNIIMWLDYDSALNKDILSDFAILSRKCRKNDIVIFTLNVTCPKCIETRRQVMEPFAEFVSQKYQPFNKFLIENKFSYLYQDICLNYFADKCTSRNLRFNKFFAIEYADNATMLTIAGIMGETDEVVKKLAHPYVRTDDQIIAIKIPNLTYKEKFYLDSRIDQIKKSIDRIVQTIEKKQISLDDAKEFVRNELEMEFELSIEDLKQYAEYYKYYPQYYEGII